nr:MT-A70 family methyltransferase [Hyphomicrobium sulfonivorans]
MKTVLVRNRLRPISDETVKTLAESMKQVGQLQPIGIHQPNETAYLVMGHHRLAAAKLLGWETIRATVLPDDMTDDELQLAEIDENLARGDLSPAERAIHVQRRKAIYEQQHPEAKHGATGRRGKKDANFASFADDTASKTGRSKRSVAQDSTRAMKIERIADVVGTVLDKGDELDALAKLPPERQEQVIEKAKAGERVSAKVEARKHKRSQIEAKTAHKITALPDKRYGVIYADPEWKFEAWSEETTSQGPQDHYAVNDTETIAARDVASIAAPDCVLFLWATVPMLPDALRVMESWGFRYKSQLAWVKDVVGTGYWARNKHELLLIGTRGNIPAPAPGENPESAIAAAVGAHSEKPEIFAEIIERMFPSIPKIELNRRGPARTGWDAWGAECEAHAA